MLEPRKSFAVLIAVVAIIATGVPSDAAIKVGRACSKEGLVRAVNGKELKCGVTKKGLVWRATKARKATTPVPKPSPQEEVKRLQVTVLSLSSNKENSRAGDQVTDQIRFTSNLPVVKVDGYFTRDGSTKDFEGSGELISGTQIEGEWRITFNVPRGIEPGRYLRIYQAQSDDGQQVRLSEFPLEILEPRYYVHATCSESTGDCPKEDAEASRLSIAQCRLVDQTTFTDGPTNGFPRPKNARTGARAAKILIVPFSFKDVPFTQPNDVTLTKLEQEFSEVQDFYSRNSYDRLKLNFTIVDRDKWIYIDEEWEKWKARYNGDLTEITGAAVNLSSAIDLTGYDSIFFGSGKSESLYWGGGTGFTYSTPRGPVANIYYTVGGSKLSLDHNLGHTLFHLEDLYIHGYFLQTGKYATSTPLGYDVMGGGGDYSGWSRWLNGWLDDDDIHCLSRSLNRAVVKVDFINEKQGKRLLMIPTAPGKAVFAEFRESDEISSRGVWVYTLDSTIGHGAGPMEGGKELITTANPQLSKWGFNFKLISATQKSVYLEVTRLFS